MTMNNWCVILNPRAGRGQAARRRKELEEALQAAALSFNLRTTSQAGDATRLAREAIGQGHERIAVVGGDGTLHEVVQGILGSEAGQQVQLGIIPLGTGCDFVKSLEGFALNDISGAVSRLAAGRARQVDIGKVTISSAAGEQRLFFINNLALGIDAAVADFSQRVPLLTGIASYLAGALPALATYRVRPVHLRYNDTQVYQGWLLATIASGRCQGGGFWLTPDALLDDGLLDLCLVERLRPDQIVRYILRAMRGTHTSLPRVQMARASHITLDYPTPALVVADGEIVARDASRLEISVLPRALTLLA